MTMSKSNDISNIATLDDHRALADSELDAVSGGDVSPISIILKDLHDVRSAIIRNTTA
jgi:hypothetical protein